MEVKTVFVQVEDAHVSRVADLLNLIEPKEYQFLILPMSAKFLTKDEIARLAERIPE